MVFYFHPSTTNAGPYFRTIPLLPQGGGLVEEVFVKNGEAVEAGSPLCIILDSSQAASVSIAESQIASAFVQAQAQLDGARAQQVQAESSLAQTENELAKKQVLASRGQQLVSQIESGSP